MHDLYWCIVWLALPAVIVLNYHLALIAAWHASCKWKLTTLSIQDMYTKHIKLTQSKKKLVFYCLLHYIREHTWSIMALTFENGNFILTYKGHLENKTTIKSIGYLSHEIYGKNNWYVWEDGILATTTSIVLSQNLCCE